MPNYIKMLKLEGHEEGGYFSVNYKATDVVLPLDSRYKNQNNDEEICRSAGSSIYFLLDQKDFSAWHRLKSDEIWHYYDGGSPIDIHVIDHNGQLKTYTLGNPGIIENASFQIVIKAGLWFAAEVRDKTSFALVGCTVNPAFEYDDFILANREYLSNQYPVHKPIIEKLTRTVPIQSNSWKTKALRYATLALVSGIGLYTLARENETVSMYVDNLVKMRSGK